MLTDVDAARHCGNSDFTTTISCEMMIQQESKKLPNFLLLSSCRAGWMFRSRRSQRGVLLDKGAVESLLWKVARVWQCGGNYTFTQLHLPKAINVNGRVIHSYVGHSPLTAVAYLRCMCLSACGHDWAHRGEQVKAAQPADDTVHLRKARSFPTRL